MAGETAVPAMGSTGGGGSTQNFSLEDLVHAAQHGDYPFLEVAIESHNISPSTVDAEGCSLLHWASINNRLEIVKFLSSKSMDLNYSGGANNETALQWAVRNVRSTELVAHLLSHEVDLRWRSKYGLDALFIAVQTGNFNVVYLLLTRGADPNTSSLPTSKRKRSTSIKISQDTHARCMQEHVEVQWCTTHGDK